jgi:alpha-amylase
MLNSIDESFLSEFMIHVRQNSSKPSLFGVGEFWEDSVDKIDAYLQK